MAGIYIHIPFCKQACSYCNFHFSTSLKNKEALIKAIQIELEQRSIEITEPINSIYFGGGTPSLLSKFEIEKLMATVHQSFRVVQDAEVTFEANPDDLSKEKAKELRSIGINRLSIGVQSFHDDDLLFMDRAHNANEAKNAILYCQEAGFENINIDLIFGIHTLSDEKWEENLKTIKSLNLTHLSAYSLTVEENTKLLYQIKKGHLEAVDDEKSFRQYMMLQAFLSSNFEQYELSNYAKPGFRSLHNSSYWNLSPYLGIGPSSHSFDGKIRRWNVSNNALYIKKVNAGSVYHESEKLTEREQYHDFLIVRLRTVEGIYFQELKAHFSKSIQQHFFNEIGMLDTAEVVLTEHSISIKPSSLFLSDEIVRQLMID